MGEKTGSAAETRVSLPPREVLPRMAYTGRPVADSGEGPGPPFFLDQTEARRAEKNFWRPLPPLISGSE